MVVENAKFEGNQFELVSSAQRLCVPSRRKQHSIGAAAPGHVRDRLGLANTTIAGMGLLGCRALPITELNRATAVGIERELLREELEAAVAWLDANAPAWALQVAPIVTSEIICDYTRT
ncbi:hypothetical protein GTW51_22240 [Aurantimonas aggregata]|uniref:Uncharacterized protein n=1 Tax=Aurantimonas aggregata TaxID=2047720 RepID=A0A6L9MNS8_9HYPH|nr:hypothetical protein [Aurantimonas aggregata]NDV89382.1 hypothetical protein [Aurantimonas aggregata]